MRIVPKHLSREIGDRSDRWVRIQLRKKFKRPKGGTWVWDESSVREVRAWLKQRLKETTK